MSKCAKGGRPQWFPTYLQVDDITTTLEIRLSPAERVFTGFIMASDPQSQEPHARVRPKRAVSWSKAPSLHPFIKEFLA